MTAQELIKMANLGIVGINQKLNIYSGYDIYIPGADALFVNNEWWPEEKGNIMPKEEKVILADIMIALWQKYKDAII